MTVVSGTNSTPTGTSTIVDKPVTVETTLSQAVLIPTVSDGVTLTYTPEWVTSLSTSTGPDGTFLT